MNKIDVEKLSNEELLNVQSIISEKLAAILNDASNQANIFLEKYNMEAQLIFELKKKD